MWTSTAILLRQWKELPVSDQRGESSLTMKHTTATRKTFRRLNSARNNESFDATLMAPVRVDGPVQPGQPLRGIMRCGLDGGKDWRREGGGRSLSP